MKTYYFMLRGCFLAIASACAFSANAGLFSLGTFTGDADSGISTSANYTHTIDFNGTGDNYASLNINGVTFTSGGPGDQTATLKYNLGGQSLPFSIGSLGTNYDPGMTGQIDAMMRNFYYGSAEDESLTLTGLKPNTSYAARFYGTPFGPKGGRYDHITDSQGGTIFYDENRTADTGTGTILTDTYTTGAGQTSISFNWSIDTTDGVGNVTLNTDSYHQYGFSNEVVPEPTSLGVAGLAGLAILVRRKRRAVL